MPEFVFCTLVSTATTWFPPLSSTVKAFVEEAATVKLEPETFVEVPITIAPVEEEMESKSVEDAKVKLADERNPVAEP